MTNKDTRAALEAACARAVDSMMQRDEFDVAVTHVNAGDHVVRIMTREAYDLDGEQMRRYRDGLDDARTELAKARAEAHHHDNSATEYACELAREQTAHANTHVLLEQARAELARQTGIAVDHCERADAAERMVAELRAKLHGMTSWAGEVERAMNAAERARDEVQAKYDARRLSRDHAGDALARAESTARRIGAVCNGRGVVESLGNSEVETDIRKMVLGYVEQMQDIAKSRDEVGIQLAAAQAEIARMRPVVEAARRVSCSIDYLDAKQADRDLDDALRALDAVPGDALAPVVRGAPFDEAATVNPDKLTAALEASGIDASNVKDGE